MKFGAIDIGTNAARLLIGEVVMNNEGYNFIKKISYTRVPLRLGIDVFENGLISPTKKEEFIKSIQAFKLISEVFHVEDLRACATSAMREAKNGKSVKKDILKETGVNIEVIDGSEEAELIFSTFFLLDFEKDKPFIVIDVGGGSTEISIFIDGKIVEAKSFKIGTLRLLQNKVKSSVWKDIDKWLDKNIKLKTNYQVFGTGGNINKIHKLFGKQFMQPLYLDDLEDLYKSLEPLPIEERIKNYNLKQDRADVIVPALKIYTHCLKHLNAYKIYAPKIGLSDGIIYDLYNKFLAKDQVVPNK